MTTPEAQPKEQERLKEDLERIVRDEFRNFAFAVLRRLRDRGFDVGDLQLHEKPPALAVGVRHAVLDLVSERDYLTSSQIANLLSTEINTRSSNPRQVVLSTVSSMTRERILAKDQLGRLSIAEKEEVAAAR